MTWEYNNYLAHHGIPGMRWGHRKEKYKQAGQRHALHGHSQMRTGSAISSGKSPAKQNSQDRRESEKAEQDRKEKTKKILMVAGGVAVAALAGYAAYKGGKSLKSWSNDAYAYRSGINRTRTTMAANRFESMRAGGWSKAAEKSYRKNMRKMDRAELKSYFTRRKHWS